MTKVKAATIAATVMVSLVSPQDVTRATVGAAAVQAQDHGGALDVYLARHGQTDWNREGRLQGSADTPLNTTGRQQAIQLRDRLKGVHLDAVYSSDLRRSRETAEIVRGVTPLTAVAGLNERRLGMFQGQPGGAEYERRSQEPDDTLSGGESLSQFVDRVRIALNGILARHRSGAILVVGHGGTNQAIVRTLFGLSAQQAAAFQQGNDDLYLCQLTAGRAVRFWRLVVPDQ